MPSSSHQFPALSHQGYFDFQPSSPVKTKGQQQQQQPNVLCLDAFHQRPSTAVSLAPSPMFEYPPHASIYAKRALPPLPPPLATNIPPLRRSVSIESMSSPVDSAVAECCPTDKCLPPLPLQRTPSIESFASSKPSVVSTVRPRTGRNMSFRGFLSRPSSTATSSPTDDTHSMSSSVSSICTRDSRTDSIMGDLGLTLVKTNASTVSACSGPTGGPTGRRPSALSITQIRAANKKFNSNATAQLPSRPTSARKSSFGAGTARWNPFGRAADENKEDIPPMPATPPFVQELSFTQCYYFFARNCNGYVISNGINGDACENCANSGYLGSP